MTATTDRNDAFHDAVRLAVVDAFANPVVQTVLRDTSYSAAKTAIRDQLLTVGIDMNRPGEVAKDMTQLREWRLLVKSSRMLVRKSVIGVIVAGFMGIVGLGLKDWVLTVVTRH